MTKIDEVQVPKVSVIVPVYNVGKYLEECLNSIVSQTLKDIEVIIINDGSTDDSLEIAKRFADKDTRVKVVTQENGGYAKAVNNGLSLATGEYVAEVDSDDYLNLNMYNKLYTIAKEKNVDIVVGRYAEFVGKDLSFKMFPKSFVGEEYQNVKLSVEEIYKNNDLELLGFTGIWSAIYKRELVTKNNITLNENVKCYNDNGFWFRTRAVAKSIYYDDEIMYFYRVDVAGQTIKKMNERYPVLINEFIDIKEQYKKMGIWEENANFWFRHMVNNVLYFVMPKIELETMTPFVEAVKPILQDYLNHETLLPGTIDKFTTDILNVLMKKGVSAFIDEYLKYKYKVSVVMAVYNGEKYLDTTIQQILNQSLQDIEFIIVNDGSTDSSLEIINKYQYDFRLKVINLEKNVGQSCARNIGFQQAISKYVLFLDCDDDFNSELVGKLYWHMNEYKLDVCMSGFTIHNCKTGKESVNTFENFPRNVFDGAKLTSSEFNQIVGWNWDKMYRKEFIKENKLFFPEDLRVSEDALVAYPAILKADRVFVVKESLITYKECGSNSVSSKMSNHIVDNFKYYDRILDFLKDNNLAVSHEKHFIHLFVNHSMFAFENLINSEKAKEEFFDLLVGEYIPKFNISNRIPESYFDNDDVAFKYKQLRRMMKYKPGEYRKYLSDLNKVPLYVDDHKFGYEYDNENIVIIKEKEQENYGKWIFAFDDYAKKTKHDWVNIANIYLLKDTFQDNYFSLTFTLLKNTSYFVSSTLNIAITAVDGVQTINMFSWEKNTKLDTVIAYTIKDDVLKLFADFTGAWDGVSVKVNLVESRSDDLPTICLSEKRYLSPADCVQRPEDLSFATNAKGTKGKNAKKHKKSIIRFLLKKENRHKLISKLETFMNK